ncbi:MAG: ABC transporter ATP-binding protein [Vagococcus sp.]|uniref:ABC transporter ATP-binding protein n=1 Tax=Vagococcus sp. TaxID=1933889 RepID=UPI002FC7C1DE
MTHLKQFFMRNKKLSLLTLLSLMLQTLGTLAVPFLIAQLIDVGIASSNQTLVIKIGIEMLLVALVGGGAAVYGSYLSAKLAAQYGYETRRAFYGKIQDFSIQDIETYGVSSLLTRMMNDVTNVQRALVMSLQLILPAPIICVFAVVMTFINSPKLALIPFVSIVIYLLVIFWLLKKGLPLSSTIQIKLDKMMVKMREFFNGINMIRAFDNQEEEEEKTNHRFFEYAESMTRVNKIFAYLTPVAYLIMGLVFALIIWVGSLLVGSGDIQIGVVTAVVEYSMQTLGYLIMAAMVIVTLPRSLASLKRINIILDTEPEITDSVTPTTQALEKKRKKSEALVSLKHVTFAYNGAEPVLENISFDVLRGKTTAIVGGTGSGKSTIAKVILNLTTIRDGQITLDNTPITEWSQDRLREKISYVPQKAFLFSGTIESNLKMGNPNASKEELKRAAHIAQATDFINNQEKGYQSFVAQGGNNFSGGQKQRLSIARALVKPADLYIFDDSFSALDYQTDANLRKSLTHHMPEATFLIVAQRLSTIKEADHIIVLDEGRVVGQGTHQELLQSNQTYQEFATSQGISY